MEKQHAQRPGVGCGGDHLLLPWLQRPVSLQGRRSQVAKPHVLFETEITRREYEEFHSHEQGKTWESQEAHEGRSHLDDRQLDNALVCQSVGAGTGDSEVGDSGGSVRARDYVAVEPEEGEEVERGEQEDQAAEHLPQEHHQQVR